MPRGGDVDDQAEQLARVVAELGHKCKPEPAHLTAAWWLSSRMLLMLLFVLFIVWSGVLDYG